MYRFGATFSVLISILSYWIPCARRLTETAAAAVNAEIMNLSCIRLSPMCGSIPQADSWRSRRRCVMNDAPTVRGLTKYQSKTPMRRVVGADQFPAAVGQHQRRTQRLEIQFGESKRTHLLARRVTPLVPVEYGLPSPREFVARDESGRLRAFIAIHEAINVATIP